MLCKGKGAVDHSTLNSGLMKFCSGCKNGDDQARLGWFKTGDSKAVFQAKEAIPETIIWRVSDELSIL